MVDPVRSSRPFGQRLRRTVFFLLVLSSTMVATGLLSGVYQTHGIRPLELLLLVLYTILFLWLSLSFWTAALGFWVTLIRRDDHSIARRSQPPEPGYRVPLEARTAVLMPIYHEDPKRVLAGLRAIYESLAATGSLDAFEFFVLSDTRNPDLWVEEELIWRQLCEALGAGGRIYYRNRVQNTERKAGNIADFVRNWGGRYRYMIVLDADSLMEGQTLVEMVRRMERNPDVGLIQTPPVPVGNESLFARILQFAGSLYGPMFTTGLNFWQLGDSNFWGHNAIIRTRAFADHCGLPQLSGREPFGGTILSHDFVEAALLRRAGWQVWLAYDLKGSFEEIPTTLIDYAKRDRRWCQGNLQHARLLTVQGFSALCRVHFAMGVMSYLSSPLWFLFLVVTGLDAYLQSKEVWVYFFGYSIFPVWPTSYEFEMTTVLAVTLAFLFLPKILSLLLVICSGRQRRAFGGFFPVLLSVLLESLYATLVAPVLMLFHSRFVLSILLRQDVGWPAQRRGDHATSFGEALYAHWFHTLLGIVAGIASYFYVPNFFWWFTPVLAGLLLSIPVSMLTSRIDSGRCARRLRLFLTPEETNPSGVVRLLRQHAAEPFGADDQPAARWCEAIVDPFVNALHRSLLLTEQPLSRRRKHYLEGLVHQIEEDGPASLTPAEKRALISHPEMLRRLHFYVWALRPAWAEPAVRKAMSRAVP